MDREIQPVNNLNQMAADIHEASKNMSFHGLSVKQKRYCMAYAGDPVAAVREAGYCARGLNEVYAIISSLMKDDRVRMNIEVIDKMLVRYCIASAVEIKLQLSDRLRSDDLTDGNRAAFSKIMLQTHGALSERMIMQSHHTEDNTFRIVVESHAPTSIEEQQEFDRLERAVAEDQRNQLIAMGKDVPKMDP